MTYYKQGDKVRANGYDGVIVRHYDGTMYEVRLPGGVAVVCSSDIVPRDRNALLEMALNHASVSLAMLDPLAEHHNAVLIDEALREIKTKEATR